MLDEECLSTPVSLNELEIVWAEYNLAQEKIKTCQNVVGQEFLLLFFLVFNIRRYLLRKQDCSYCIDTLCEILIFTVSLSLFDYVIACKKGRE